MKTCRFKNKIIDYLYGELKGIELDEFKNHMDTCCYCSEFLHNFLYTKQLLSKKIRPQPQKSFLNYYHQKLKEIYHNDNIINRRLQKIIQNVIIRPSIAVRLAKIAVILILGIFIGKSLNRTEIPPRMVSRNNAETRFLKNYLFETELLLLEISNCDREQDLKFLLSNNNCKTLLQKTLFLKEQAKKYNNIRLLDLLDRLEIILLESANMDDSDSAEQLNYVRKNIKDWHIFVELKQMASLIIL